MSLLDNETIGVAPAENSSQQAFNMTERFAFAVKCLDFFNFYYLAIIVLFGMVGNFLSFLVFTRTHLRLRSSSYYLAALALADIGFLLTLLVVWLNHVGIDLFNRQGFCQALVYGSSAFSCLSVWLTVAFTFERLIAVQYPLQRSYMCTVHRAKIIISVLTVTTFLVHSYSLFTAGITEGAEGKTMCDLLPDYYKFMHVVNLIDTVVTLVIPLILIVVMNMLIARALIVFSRTFKKPAPGSSFQHIQMKTLRMIETNYNERDSGHGSVMSNPPSMHHLQHQSPHQNSAGNLNHHQLPPVPEMRRSSSAHNLNRISNGATVATINTQRNSLAIPHDIIIQQPSTSSSNLLAGPVAAPNALETMTPDRGNLLSYEIALGAEEKLSQRNILSIRTQYSITKMLLLISTVFIMLNLPSYVVRLQVFVSDVMATGSEVSSMAWLMQQFFMLLYYTNFSINFLLYAICGATFRHCLCRLVRDKIDALRRFGHRLRSCCSAQ